MKLRIDGAKGELASQPERVLAAIVRLAVEDGAHPNVWLAKALKSVGVKSMEIEVTRTPKYQVADDIANEALDVYQQRIAKMQSDIIGALNDASQSFPAEDYIDAIERSLRKANSTIPTWVPMVVIRSIQRMVHDAHSAVNAVVFGRQSVTGPEWSQASKEGMTGQDPLMWLAHAYGALSAKQDPKITQTTSLSQLRDELPPTKSRIMERAAAYVTRKGAMAIANLGARIGSAIASKVTVQHEDDDDHFRQIVRDQVAAGLGDEEAAHRNGVLGLSGGLTPAYVRSRLKVSVQEVARAISEASGDWDRDMIRIAQTETHTAIQEGIGEEWQEEAHDFAIESGEPIAPVLVFKLPRPDACTHCIELHLEDDHPRIFYFSDLSANGDNHGRKSQDWKAVIGSVHPYCACTLHRVPAIMASAMPADWHSGQAVPSVIGPGGQLVIT